MPLGFLIHSASSRNEYQESFSGGRGISYFSLYNEPLQAKDESIVVNSRGGRLGSEMSRLPNSLVNRPRDRGKVSRTRRPPSIYSDEDSWYSFVLEDEATTRIYCGCIYNCIVYSAVPGFSLPISSSEVKILLLCYAFFSCTSRTEQIFKKKRKGRRPSLWRADNVIWQEPIGFVTALVLQPYRYLAGPIALQWSVNCRGRSQRKCIFFSW
jgi:hypothetical protein